MRLGPGDISARGSFSVESVGTAFKDAFLYGLIFPPVMFGCCKLSSTGPNVETEASPDVYQPF